MAYPDPSSVSAKLYDRAVRVLPGGTTRLTVYQSPYPTYFASGNGSTVIDVDGHRCVDFVNNQSSLIHGHCYPPIIDAVCRQLALGTCYSGPTAHEINLAEHLLNRFGRPDQFIRFANSGTEAVMLAVKLVRAVTGRALVAKCEGAYHGAYDFVEPSQAEISGDWSETETPTALPYSVGTPRSVLDSILMLPYNDIENSLRILEHHHSSLAGVIIEPIANRSGLIPAKREYLAALRAFCTAKKIPLIFDEVISFRVGLGGAQTDYNVFPDLTVLAKIIGGGFPIGAVLGASDIMAALDPRKGQPAVPSTGTFNANPISMIAGLVAMEHFGQAQIARVNALCESMCSAIRGILKRLGEPAQIFNRGSLFRLHLSADEIHDYRSGKPTTAIAHRLSEIQRRLVHEGFLISKLCAGNISTVTTSAEIDRFLIAFEFVLSETRQSKNAGKTNLSLAVP